MLAATRRSYFLLVAVVLSLCVLALCLQFSEKLPLALSSSLFRATTVAHRTWSSGQVERHQEALPDSSMCAAGNSQGNANPFEQPLPGVWLPAGVSGFAVISGGMTTKGDNTTTDDGNTTANDDDAMTDNDTTKLRLYYKSGTFYLFTDDVDGAAHVLRRSMHPHSDFPFQVLPARQRPKSSKRFKGTTWLLLCPQEQGSLIDHYFHLMEFLVGLWPVDQLQQRHASTTPETPGSESMSTLVTNVVLGPKLLQWERAGQSINRILLNALHPNATLWDAHHPLPFSEADPFWVSFDRAIIAERFATGQDELVKHTNKMDMAIAKWAMQHEPSVWENFKEIVLDRLCPDGCTAMPSSSLQPVMQKDAGGQEYMTCQRKPNLTYVSRQRNSRRLRHSIAQELEHLLLTEWTDYFNTRIVYMQDLSPQEQIQIAAQTDILLGVHGNGLTHGFWMPKGGVIVEMQVQGACLWDFQFIASIGGQRWVGIDWQGLLSPGNTGYCGFLGWDVSAENDVVVDLRQLEAVLLTVKTIYSNDPRYVRADVYEFISV